MFGGNNQGQGQATNNPGFGAQSTFGTSPNMFSSGGNNSGFGSVFGSTTTTTSATAAPIFGGVASSTGFGSQGQFGSGTGTTNSGFGSMSGGFGAGSGIFSGITSTTGGFGSSGTGAQSFLSTSGGFGSLTSSSSQAGFGGSGTGAQPFSSTTGGFGAVTGSSNNNQTGFGTSGTGGFGMVSGPSSGNQGATSDKSGGPFNSEPKFGAANLFGGSAAQVGSTSSSTIGSGGSIQSGTPVAFGGRDIATTGSTFGTTTQTGSLFGSTTHTGSSTTPTGSLFASTTHTGSSTTPTGSLFASTTPTGSLFGSTTQTGSSTTPTGSLFGSTTQTGSSTTPTGSLFGSTTQAGSSTTPTGSLFGSTTQAGRSTTPTGGLFSSTIQTGGSTTQNQGLFGKKTETGSEILPSESPFGVAPQTKTTSTSSLFSGTSQQKEGEKSEAKSMFGGIPKENTSSSNIFGGMTQTSTKSSLFGGADDKPKTLFGKPQPPSESLFSKPPSEEKIAVTLFGKPVKEDGKQRSWTNKDTDDSSQIPGRRMIRRPVTDNLFNKALSDLSEGRKETSVEGQVEGLEGQDDSLDRKPMLRRRSSVVQEDLSSKVAIVCNRVPAKFNNVIEMRKHFSKYGKVHRVYANPRKGQVTVHFVDHESAKNAKVRGRVVARGFEPMEIFWSAFSSKPGQTPAIRKSPMSREVKRPAGDVDDELQGMAGTSDMPFGESRPLERTKTRELGGFARSRSPGPINRSPSPKPRTQSPALTKSHDLQGMVKGLSGSVGRNSQEKYEIMLNSDKLVREALGLHMKKQTDLADAKTLTASCMDMCPEKERYQREYQRRLSVYEMLPETDQVDHTKAVKEYSRSSADQDLPLPTELRPPEVLDKTMNYLLNNIADDGGDGKWGDWFDFLWNRMRSIRKEITQLQLCDLITVSLVEKCTRFHIYCSERLCEEDMMVFDEKINNENLTKCLQTLKEIYHDLETKKGVLCPNEAEFRSYIVLMNLNEGEVLSEVQQLRTEVRESAELRFVRNVHSAINSNNYIRFFKLVGQAEFLPACIMHRYFNQVRAKALHIMSKAYKNNPLPVSELRRLLLFESDSEVSNFCNHHGLTVQEDQIAMDKHAIITPEQSFTPTRAEDVIESKQHTSVGEAINGGPLPPNTLTQPSNSFDTDGHFIISSLPIPASALEGKVPTTGSSQSVSKPWIGQQKPVLFEEKPSASKPVYTNEQVKEVAKELFVDVIKEFSTNMATTFVKAINVYLQKADPLLEDLLQETLSEEARSVVDDCTVEYQLEQAEMLAREKAERSLAKDRSAQQITQDLVDLVINEQVMEIAAEEYSLVEEELKQQSIERVSRDFSLDLLREVVSEECEDVSESVYQTDVIDRKQQLQETSTAVQLLVKSRFFNRWKNRLAGRQRLQKSMATFPPAPSMNSMEEQLQTMLPESEGVTENWLHIGSNARITLMAPGNVLENQARIQKSLVLQKYWSRIRHEKAWAPIDATQIVGQQLVRIKKSQCKVTKPWSGKVERLYWKLLVCLPDSHEDKNTRVLCDWVKTKFTRGTVPNSTAPDLTRLWSLYHQEVSPHHEVGLCIRAVKGVPTRQGRSMLYSQGCLEAASAILFVLKPLPNEPVNMEDYWMVETSRLRVITEKNNDLNLQPPLVVLVPFSDYTENEIRRYLEIITFIEDDLVSDCDIMVLNNGLEHPATSRKLIQAIQGLASRWRDVVLPSKDNLRDFVEETVYREFYGVVYQDLAERGKSGGLHHGPEQLLALYNSLVDHMAEVLSDQNLTLVPWPLPEFVDTCKELPHIGWNSPEYLNSLRETILELSLPDWEYDSPSEDWSEAVDDVWSYIDVVAEDGGNNAALFSKINNLLVKAREGFEEQCFISLGQDDCVPLYVNMPWSDILMACVGYRLNMLQPAHSDRDEVEVYYLSSRLKEFTPPPEWFNTVRTQQQDMPVMKDSFIRSVKRKHDDSTTFHSSPKYRLPSSPSISLDPENTSQLISKELGHDLDNAIANEKKANADFEAYLQQTLEAGESVDMCEEIDLSFAPLELEVPMFRRLSAPAASFFSPGLIKSRGQTEKKSGAIFYSPGIGRSTERPKSAQGRYESLERNVSMTDRLDLLNNSLNSQKQANKLFEMRLQSFIDMDKF